MKRDDDNAARQRGGAPSEYPGQLRPPRDANHPPGHQDGTERERERDPGPTPPRPSPPSRDVGVHNDADDETTTTTQPTLSFRGPRTAARTPAPITTKTPVKTRTRAPTKTPGRPAGH